ncbi:MAG: helix-turn-helix transcriptional regulator [Bacilli bacterium]|nr:helix-turn-helix transcriptional regulator [Bacilli bacterium]
MDKIEEEIAGRIKEMMDKRKVNQSELARELGVHQYDISRMLNGKPFPSISQLTMIANYLDCSLYYLIGIQQESYRELSPETRKIADAYQSANETIKAVVDLVLTNKQINK